jgi:hypothetical protein
LRESVGGAQRGKAQRIRRFEHDKRLLALGEQTIEIERGARQGIAGHDQTLDRRIIRHPHGAGYARRGEDQECAGDPASRSQYAEEDLNDLGRSWHNHG